MFENENGILLGKFHNANLKLAILAIEKIFYVYCEEHLPLNPLMTSHDVSGRFTNRQHCMMVLE